jgi:hypothetical protein
MNPPAYIPVCACLHGGPRSYACTYACLHVHACRGMHPWGTLCTTPVLNTVQGPANTHAWGPLTATRPPHRPPPIRRQQAAALVVAFGPEILRGHLHRLLPLIPGRPCELQRHCMQPHAPCASSRHAAASSHVHWRRRRPDRRHWQPLTCAAQQCECPSVLTQATLRSPRAGPQHERTLRAQQAATPAAWLAPTSTGSSLRPMPVAAPCPTCRRGTAWNTLMAMWSCST